MSGSIICLGGVQMDIRFKNGTPVRLDDGREGWVQGCTFERIAMNDDPTSPEIVTRIADYAVRLTSGRGTVSKPAMKVFRLARDPRPAQPITPKGAA